MYKTVLNFNVNVQNKFTHASAGSGAYCFYCWSTAIYAHSQYTAMTGAIWDPYLLSSASQYNDPASQDPYTW